MDPFREQLKQAIQADPSLFGSLVQHAENSVRSLFAPQGGGASIPGVLGSVLGKNGGFSLPGILGNIPGMGGSLGGIAGSAIGPVLGSCFPSGPSPSLLPDFKGGCFPGAGSGTGLSTSLMNAGKGILNSLPGMAMSLWQPGADASAGEVAGHAVATKLMQQLQAAGFSPDALQDKLDALFNGASSAANIPLALGSKNKSSVMINGGFFAVRMTDPAEFPKDADLGSVVEGNPTVLAGDLAVSGKGHLCIGAIKGTVGGIELVSPNVLMGALSVISAPENSDPPSLPESSGDAGPATGAGGGGESVPPASKPSATNPPANPGKPPSQSTASDSNSNLPTPKNENSSSPEQNSTPPTVPAKPNGNPGDGEQAPTNPDSTPTPMAPATELPVPTQDQSGTGESTPPTELPEAKPGPSAPQSLSETPVAGSGGRTIGGMWWDLINQRLNRAERDLLLNAVNQAQGDGWMGALSGLTGIPTMIRVEIGYQNNRGNFRAQAKAASELPVEVAKNAVMNKAFGMLFKGIGNTYKAAKAWATAGSSTADEAASGMVTVFRGQPPANVIKSKAAIEGGYNHSKDVIAKNELDDLFAQHAADSSKPPSPFISTSTDRRVAEYFAGPDGVVYELRVPAERAFPNPYNQYAVPAGPGGSLIPESEVLIPNYVRPSEIVNKVIK